MGKPILLLMYLCIQCRGVEIDLQTHPFLFKVRVQFGTRRK
jgi:hypothetical protein